MILEREHVNDDSSFATIWIFARMIPLVKNQEVDESFATIWIFARMIR